MADVRQPSRTQQSKVPKYSNKNESKRDKLVGALIQGHTKSEACAIAGTSLSAPSRILKRVRETGSIRDRPHPGRQPCYTPEVFQQANKVAADLPTHACTATNVFKVLVQNRVVHEGANVQAFRRAWKTYNHSSKIHMRLDDTSTSIYLAPSDSKSRLQFARRMLRLLDSPTPPVLDFFDETTLELSPHPKSRTYIALSGSAYHNVDCIIT